MPAFLSRALGLAVGVAVGAFLLSVALRGVDLPAVTSALLHGSWTGPAAIALLGTAVYVVAKAVRWRLLLGPVSPAPLSDLVRSTTAGLALNALVPHAGEFVRALSLNRQTGRSGAGVLASIVAERVFDLFAVMLLAAAAVVLTPVPAAVTGAVRVLGGLALTGAVLILTVLVWPEPFRRLAVLVSRPLPGGVRTWFLREVDAALQGFAPVRSPGLSARVLFWSLVQWLAIALCAAACCWVVGEGVGVGSALLVVVGIVVAFLLPNAPGYAGSVQIAFVASLSPSGVPAATAVAASIVYQLLMILPVVALGLGWLRGCLAAPMTRPSGS